MVVLRHRKHSEGFRMSRLHTRQCSDSVAFLPSSDSSRKESEVQTPDLKHTRVKSDSALIWSSWLTWGEVREYFWILGDSNVHLSSLLINLTEATIPGGDLHCRCLRTVTTTLLWAGGKSTGLAFANLLFQIHTNISIHLELFSCRPMNVSPVFTQLTGSWRKHLVV